MAKAIKVIKARMFQSYCSYRWQDAHKTDNDVVPYRQALAIDLLCEDCFGHDLIDYWHMLDEDTQENLAYGSMSDREIVALMDYLNVKLTEWHEC